MYSIFNLRSQPRNINFSYLSIQMCERSVRVPVSTKVCLCLQETRQPPPFRRMLRMNSPEWSFIAIGCVAAMVTGALQPCFAIIFAEIMGVSNFY